MSGKKIKAVLLTTDSQAAAYTTLHRFRAAEPTADLDLLDVLQTQAVKTPHRWAVVRYAGERTAAA